LKGREKKSPFMCILSRETVGGEKIGAATRTGKENVRDPLGSTVLSGAKAQPPKSKKIRERLKWGPKVGTKSLTKRFFRVN